MPIGDPISCPHCGGQHDYQDQVQSCGEGKKYSEARRAGASPGEAFEQAHGRKKR